MAENKREVERKYELPEVPAGGHPPGLPDLTGVNGVRAVVGAGVVELDAVYYDTDDLRLTRAARTLRRRTGGDDAGWHLKLPVRAEEREEMRAPLGTADEVPDELVRLVRSRVRHAPLRPVVRLRTSRDVTRLIGRDGAALAEVSVDTVRAARLIKTPSATSWIEVEVELADGADRRLLDAVGKRLSAAGLRPSAAPSKLARALAETGGADIPAGGPPAAPVTAGDHVMAYVRAQVEAIVDQDPAVRRDRPDSVHQFRVATRRLRSALRSYRSVLDRSVTDSLVEELRWLGVELGVDRDQEVLAARLWSQLDAVPDTLVLGPVRARLQAWDVGERVDARLRTVSVLDDERYLALLDRLDALLADPPLRKAAGKAPRRVLPASIRKDYERLAHRTTRALALGPGEERDRALHDTRKAAKRARYAAEVARPALGKPAGRFARRMKAEQQILGDHHDSVVTREALRTLAVAAHAAGETAFTWGLLYGREEQRALTAEQRLPGAWRRASKPGLRKFLTP